MPEVLRPVLNTARSPSKGNSMAWDPSQANVVALGELVWDIFPDGTSRPGGAVGNFACHASQLGLSVSLLTRLGQDRLGEQMVAHLNTIGLSSQYVQFDVKLPTGLVTVHMGQSTGPAYTIHQPSAWDNLEATPSWLEACHQANAFVIGTLAERSANNRAVLQTCLDSLAEQCMVICDINLRAPFYSAEVVSLCLLAADVVKLNEDEFRTLTQLLNWPDLSLPGFAEKLFCEYGVKVLVVTSGASGAWAASSHEHVLMPAEKVNVVDTVGAGDAFASGMVYGLLANWNLSQVLTLANRMGAFVASEAGATPILTPESREKLFLGIVA